MKTSVLPAAVLFGLLYSPSSAAQRLLWERAFIPATVRASMSNTVTLAGSNFLMMGAHNNPVSANVCQGSLRAYFRTYTLAGTLVREKLGRNLNSGSFALNMGNNSIGWFSATGVACVNGRNLSRVLVQRLTLAGDTGRAWSMGVVPPPATYSGAVLAQGNRVLTAGYTSPANAGFQVQLTCTDTLGRMRWQRTFARPNFSQDMAADVVATPRGGYLISGDAFNFANQGNDHYVIETDSGGNLRRSRFIQPLGPGYNNGNRANNLCNVLVLPNAQGYLLSGTADSLRQFTSYSRIAYVMRLDTALNMQWVYRHPPALAGTNVVGNYGYRVRLLPNNTVGLLLTDVRGPGTPAVYVAQVDVASGRRAGFYELLSNSQAAVLPYDWQWVGDGTLLLCGKSTQAGVTGFQSYVARWDFRGTPLATGRPATAAPLRNALTLYPNPASAALTVGLPGLSAAQPATLSLFDGLGRCVRTLPATLGAAATARLDLRGLPAGLYALRVSTAGADYVGRVVVE